MKKFASKDICKKITVLILIILLCNIFVPYISYGFSGAGGPIMVMPSSEGDEEEEEDKDLFNPIVTFFCAIGDLTMILLQENIVGTDIIHNGSEYSLKYSPGIIFSGTLPAFDINFISPMPNQEKYEVIEPETDIKNIKTKTKAYYQEDGSVKVTYKTNDSAEKNEYKEGEDIVKKSDALSHIRYLQENYSYFNTTTTQKIENTNMEFDKELKEYCWWMIENSHTTSKFTIYVSHEIIETENSIEQIYQVKLTKTVLEKQATLESTARIMRKTIASWYRVMRDIALVGLLSVLVYVAIRGILSSSTTDKAKYKKMLFDWFTALVIILTLHYIISITLTVTKSISDVFNSKIVNSDGSDVIFSNLRTEIAGSGLINGFIKIVMYYCLVILTIKFTIAYFKRFIFVAFLTMIGPIIGLTYPLDKIKDGQAQAFSLWIREFLFNALIQPFHLILYYVFVGSSVMSSFAKTNPIFALVVMAFLTPAEKILRKMFGFDKGGQLGNMESAFGGAAIMNMVNKMGSKAPRGSSSNSESSNADDSAKVRMANNTNGNPYEALMGNNDSTEAQAGTVTSGVAPVRITPGGTTPEGTTSGRITSGGTAQSETASGRATLGGTASGRAISEGATPAGTASSRTTPGGGTPSGTTPGGETPSGGTSSGGAPSGGAPSGGIPSGGTPSNRASSSKKGKSNNRNVFGRVRDKTVEIYNKPTIRGARAVGGKVFKGTIKLAATGALRVAGAATLGTIGLAAGVSTGEIENAFAGAVGGILAGNRIGKNVADTTSQAVKGAGRTLRDIGTTFKEGSLGEEREKIEERAERERKVKEFKKTKKYQDLLERYSHSEEKINELLNAGIIDDTKIRIVLENNYSTDNAIAYMHLAKTCPNNIFEDRNKFVVYLESNGIPKNKADEIYKAVRKFK